MVLHSKPPEHDSHSRTAGGASVGTAVGDGTALGEGAIVTVTVGLASPPSVQPMSKAAATAASGSGERRSRVIGGVAIRCALTSTLLACG